MLNLFPNRIVCLRGGPTFPLVVKCDSFLSCRHICIRGLFSSESIAHKLDASLRTSVKQNQYRDGGKVKMPLTSLRLLQVGSTGEVSLVRGL